MPAAKEPKKLSSRLFAAVFLASLVVFLLVTAAVVFASWSVYEGNAEDRLASQAEESANAVAGLSQAEMISRLSSMVLAETRITLVADDGTVLYDTFADAASMPNHGTRAEIVSAKSGEGSIVLRNSETMGTDTLYAAVLVDDSGIVLRLSETRISLAYYLGRLAVPLAIIVLFAIALSLVLSRALTRRISAPLLAIDMEKPLESDVYVEVEPLLSRIDAQRNELIDQNSQLQKSVEIRREFTGNVSHEMKTPLQVIGGYAELIENGIAGPEDARKFAGLIREESQSMRGLIDDVLTLSRLDEPLAAESEAFDFCGACRQAIDRLEKPAEYRGIALTADLQDDVPVKGSGSLAEQLVYNLVENAIRYGRENGKVEVSLTAERGTATLVVSDDGPGIPEEARSRVFERFYRVDPSRSRNTGGTGLGLAIVKHAAESMGGTVAVGESSLGGCEFRVQLPVL